MSPDDFTGVPDDLLSRRELYKKLSEALDRHEDSGVGGFTQEYDDARKDALLDMLDLLCDHTAIHLTSYPKPKPFLKVTPREIQN